MRTLLKGSNWITKCSPSFTCLHVFMNRSHSTRTLVGMKTMDSGTMDSGGMEMITLHCKAINVSDECAF